MFLILPVGVERARVRLPVVSASIAAICLLMLLVTWTFPTVAWERDQTAILERWRVQPYLHLSPQFLTSLGPDTRVLGDHYDRWVKSHPVPSDADGAVDQAELDAMQSASLSRIEHSTFHRLALDPKRGLVQPGWVTHLFLHGGWLHLFGNLLFLYLVVPMLEDVWGRRRFLTFYLVGGVLAGIAQVALGHAQVSIVGASGAIAACMGAFAVRFAGRQISILYLVGMGIRGDAGITAWPAWSCGVLWAVSQALTLATGGGAGVAVVAHLAGFVFGAVIALAIKASGMERLTPASSEEEPLAKSELLAVVQARAALQTDDRLAARRLLTKAHAEHPDDEDVIGLLIELDLLEGHHPRSVERLEKLVLAQLSRGDSERAFEQLERVWRVIEPGQLTIEGARTLADALVVRNPDAGMLLPLWERAGASDDREGNRALIEAAELRLSFDRKSVAPLLQTLGSRKTLNLDQRQRLEGLRYRSRPQVAPDGARAIAVTLESVDASGLKLRSGSGREMNVPFSEVLRVAAARIPKPEQPNEVALLIDLVMEWSPLVTVRFDDEAQVGRHFAIDPLDHEAAAAAFLRRLFEHSTAGGIPSREALTQGEYPHFATSDAFLAAIAEASPSGQPG